MKRKCEQFQAVLDGYDVPGPAWLNRWRMAAHRRRCPDCAALWEKDQEVQHFLKTLPVLVCPEPVTQRVLAVTGADQKDRVAVRPSSHGHRWRIAMAGAAVIFSALAILFVVEESNPLSPPTDNTQYTAEEIKVARAQAQWSLAMAGRKLHQAEKEAVEEVFLNELPQSLRYSLKKSLSMIKGG